MGKNLDSEIAFSFISDLKRKFLLFYQMTTIQNAYSYQLKNFSNEMQKLINSYVKNPRSPIKELKKNVLETNNILCENVQKLLERENQLEIVVQKSQRLSGISDEFMKNIREIKRKQKYKKYKYYFIGILFVLGVIFVIYISKK